MNFKLWPPFTQGTNWLEERVKPTASLDLVKEKKISVLTEDQSPVIQYVASHLTVSWFVQFELRDLGSSRRRADRRLSSGMLRHVV
jgi:hypothetical protein